MNVDSALESVGLGVEALLALVLLGRRVGRSHPVFVFYILWSLCSDTAAILLERFWPGAYLEIYLFQASLDLLLRLAILVELGRSLQRHNRWRLPHRSIYLLLFALALVSLWGVPHWGIGSDLTLLGLILVRLQQFSAVVFLAAVLALICWSSLQTVRWPPPSLRIASGLGFYALVSLAVHLIHTRQTPGTAYHLLDEAAAASYLGVLVYWVSVFFCFEN